MFFAGSWRYFNRFELNKEQGPSPGKQRKIDTLLVWKTDTLGRSLRHLVNTIGELDVWGVAFVSLRDSLDFSTPAGRLMWGVVGDGEGAGCGACGCGGEGHHQDA